MKTPTQPPRYTVAAAMRNEAPFIVEWVAWYRMLGFEGILVATNDCTDTTPEMLNLFHEAGWLTHITHSPGPNTPPKLSAHRAFHAHPMVAETEWLLICDVDEFLVLKLGDGTLPAYMAELGRGFRGIGFHWKSFGSGGEEKWRDGLQHRIYTRAGPEKHPANTPFKSLFRHPLSFKRFSEHGPREFDGEWGQGGNIWVDGAGKPLRRYIPNERPQMATAASRVSHKGAQMNHYIIRSEESFAAKRGTLSASRKIDRYTDAFYAKYNRNEVKDLSAMEYDSRFDLVYAAAVSLPGMARLHHLGCAAYVERLCASRGEDAAKDERYVFHMDEAASAD